MKYLVIVILSFLGTFVMAQDIDSCQIQLVQCQEQLVQYQKNLDSLRTTLFQCQEENHINVESLENQARLFQETLLQYEEKERLFAEKEAIYKDALAENNVNNAIMQGEIEAKNISIESKNEQINYLQNHLKEKDESLKSQRENYERLSKERDVYLHKIDSLRSCLEEANKAIIRTNEALKYTEQRAKDAEAKISAATSKKKKVCAIQGIAMRTFRTPNWSIAPDNVAGGTTVYRIVNKNGGNIEFDYTTGAYVMLWDLTRKPKAMVCDSIQKHIELKKFDQEFSYSMGLYVGFGGSNLFKNFYVGPSLKFLDFFHFTAGINICEYEMLNGNYQEGDILPAGFSLTDQISKEWKIKPFVSLSFDLDFISYIKK